ncbi:MAG: hypothetical protein JWP89_3308 [Schlesneria sp.]|nr:hypothetical protein [Schlesneria sp.]
MSHRLSSMLFLAVILGVMWQGEVRAADAESDSSLVRHLPGGAVATAEISGLASIIERIETSEALKGYLNSPLYQEAIKTDPARKALAGKAILEAQLGMNLWSIAKTYLGDRLVMGVYPPVGIHQPDGILVIRVKNAADLSKLLEKLTPLAAFAGDAVSISDHAGGGKAFKSKDGNQVVVTDRWIVASKSSELLSQTLTNLTTSHDSGLGSEASWKLMAQQLGTQHAIQLCVNLTKVSQLLGKRVVPEKLDNPVVSLLYGGLLEYAAKSPYLGMTVDIGESGYSIQSAVAGKVSDLDDAHRALVLDPAQPLLPMTLDVSERLGVFSFSRNFLKWYKAREQLLEGKLLPEFDKFETGLATFLPGKDFAEDVLPLLTGRVAIVSAPQDYSYLDGKPGVQLPAFGLVIELAKPSEGADILNLVAQTILTISNLEAAKQKRQLWVQSSESYHNVQINFARYLQRPKGDQLATAYNFQPASTLIGNRFVLSSSLGLCRELIDAQQNKRLAETATASPNGIPNVVQELSPVVAAQLLEANAAVIHAKSIQNGKTAEQSGRELEAVCTLLRRMTAIHFDTVQYADHMRLELSGGWK